MAGKAGPGSGSKGHRRGWVRWDWAPKSGRGRASPGLAKQMGCLRGGCEVWVLWGCGAGRRLARAGHGCRPNIFITGLSVHFSSQTHHHALNNTVISKFPWSGEGLAAAGVVHGIHLILLFFFMIMLLFPLIEPQVWSSHAEKSLWTYSPS